LDDDELEPTYLERTVIAVEKYNLDCIMVGNKIMNIDETEPIPRNFLERKYLNRIGHVKIIDSNYFIFRSALNSSGMMIKRSIVLNLGGYNEDYYPGGDFEFDARVVNSDYKVGLLWEKLCITHTEVSTSMKKECIDKSIYLSFPLLQKVYHENFEYNGFLEYISNVRTFISNESRNLDLSGIQGINYKYNSFLYKLIFRIMFRMNRVIEIIER
jgi:GT2 family glycosyltransferase